MAILKASNRAARDGIYPLGLKTRLRAAWDIIRHKGPFFFLTRALPWTLRRDYSIFVQKLDSIVRFPPPSFPYVLRPAGPEDIPAILSARKGYYTAEILRRRLAGGQAGFCGWAGRELVYIHWMFSGTFYIPYLRGHLRLGPREVYADEVFTRPAFRKAGIYAYSSYLIREAIAAKGFRTLYTSVASWNGGPRRNMIRSGMNEIARGRRRGFPILGKRRWSGGVEVHDDGTFRFKFETLG